MTAFFYLLVAALVMGFVFRPLFASREELDRDTRRETRRRELIEERERVYGAIRELDFDFRMGKVDEADYRQTRARYEEQAVLVLKALDDTNGRAEALDVRVEEEIRAFRKSRNRPGAPTCTVCGAGIPGDARFCPHCGAAQKA